ncbi:MAG: 2-C-methyl-D-erythritol 4-phosphate cytidylyltransferase, partial [Pseudomonadota bacterium]|nr:2-C-methyl-D-erythritol 4-phosphate cytidylyltransferase [Pseudomonadota bacterium]
DDARWPQIHAALPKEVAVKVSTVIGGAERMQSVANALDALQPQANAHDWVLVHDAVRPCVHPADVRKLMHETANDDIGGLLGVPVRETLKECDAEHCFVTRTVDRSRIWQAATPQMFRFAMLRHALQQAQSAGQETQSAAQQAQSAAQQTQNSMQQTQSVAVVTDEAAAIEALGLRVRLVAGRSDNLKITYPGDLALASAVLEAQAREESREGARRYEP